MHVRFLEDRDVKDHHDKIIESFRAGQSYDFTSRPDSGQRWINRGIAEEVKKPEKANASPQKAGPKDGDGGVGDGADDKGPSKGGPAGGGPKR